MSVLEMNQRTVLEYRTGQVPEFNATKLMALANQMGNLKMGSKGTEEGIEDVAHVVTRSGGKENEGMNRIIVIENKAGKHFVGRLSKFQWKDAIGFFLKGNDQVVSLHFQTRFKMNLGGRMDHLYAHFYSFKALLTVFFLFARMQAIQEVSIGERIIESKGSLLTEGICMLFRATQAKHPPSVKYAFVHKSLDVMILKPRLKYTAAMRFFNSSFMFVISSDDEIRWKIIRWKHETMGYGALCGHKTQKGTLAAVMMAPGAQLQGM